MQKIMILSDINRIYVYNVKRPTTFIHLLLIIDIQLKQTSDFNIKIKKYHVGI